MKTTNPIITLKNIKHFEAHSRETNCFSATLYVNGKRFGMVDNAGMGGCDNVFPFEGGRSAVKELEKAIKEANPDLDLEIICANLIEEFLIKKDLKRVMKKICYVKSDKKGLFQLPAKHKPTPETIATVKQKASWAKDAIFLHDLSESEALEVLKNNFYADLG